MAKLLTPQMADELVDERRRRGLSLPARQFAYGTTRYRDRGNVAGSPPVFSPMDRADLIPRDQWDDIIAQKDEEKSWLEDLVRYHEIPCSDQKSTNYCHAFSTVDAMVAARAKAGHPYARLSAMSIGGPITGWRNKGAWPEDDLMRAVEYGACPYSYQDSEFSFRPKSWTPGWEKAAEDYQVDEWLDGLIPGKSFDALVTFALRSIPACVGYKWWSHAISAAYRVKKLDNGKYAVLNRNNWGMDYGDVGFLWMEEGTRRSQGTPDITVFGLTSIGATG